MFNLGKKLSSVLLCGSMAVTLLGNSGVHAANEVTEAVEDEFEEKVTAVDEHGNKVENDDEKNENTELDTNKGYQYVAEKDVAAQDPAKRSGSSFAVNVAKGLGTAALGTGIGFGLDEGWRRIGKDSSGNEEVSKDDTKIGVSTSTLQKKLDDAEMKASELQKRLDNTEFEARELQKKLEESEKIYLGNLAYGALGITGEISKLRDMVSSMFGRDFDVKSKAAITGLVISHAIGLALILWNVAKLRNKATRPEGKLGWTYTTVEMLTDLALPPVGFILQFGELILNVVSGKKPSLDKIKDLAVNLSFDDIKAVVANNININPDSVENLQQVI